MTKLNVEEQMVQGNKERGERNLGDRIRTKIIDNMTTDEKLFEELFAKTHELQDLVAKYHGDADTICCQERDIIRKLKTALEGYRKATKK